MWRTNTETGQIPSSDCNCAKLEDI
uniref:Uncharacterized protein n=1 Tax=Anguilla anguilla TaxID=7936 RepID=A0A0E9U261_ANGAN